MFGLAQRSLQKTILNTRKLATAAPRSNVYKEKTLYEAWCTDVGAYPVMGVIVFACVFCTGYGLSVMSTHPDARVGKYSRKSTMRGDFKDPTNQEDEEAIRSLINNLDTKGANLKNCQLE